MRRLITIVILTSALLQHTVSAAEPTPEITPAPGQVNPYRTRSELLMEATAYTGVTTPEQAAGVWGTGLKLRSAAMQYTVMTAALQEEYARSLDELRSNWVTGMSSPWVESFTITEIRRPAEDRAEISLRVETATSASQDPAGVYGAKLWLVREGDFWRICRLQTDEGLYYYTLF